MDLIREYSSSSEDEGEVTITGDVSQNLFNELEVSRKSAIAKSFDSHPDLGQGNGGRWRQVEHFDFLVCLGNRSDNAVSSERILPQSLGLMSEIGGWRRCVVAPLGLAPGHGALHQFSFLIYHLTFQLRLHSESKIRHAVLILSILCEYVPSLSLMLACAPVSLCYASRLSLT